MTPELIKELIISIAPSVVAILTFVGVVIKVIKEFASLKKQVADMKDLKDLRIQMQGVMEQNAELQKLNKELLTKIDHVERK